MKTGLFIVLGLIVLMGTIAMSDDTIAIINNRVADPEPEKTIPTIMEVQRYLVEQGYTIAVDGELGPETERAWNAYDSGLLQYWE